MGCRIPIVGGCIEWCVPRDTASPNCSDCVSSPNFSTLRRIATAVEFYVDVYQTKRHDTKQPK